MEPRIRAAVPTGAGGFWNYFILETELVQGARDLISALLGTRPGDLHFLHPGMGALALAWMSAEPLVYMPRLAASPLPGHPTRPVYQPVGLNDEYFPPAVYDAAALAYGNQQAGEMVWESMGSALSLDDRGELASYPVAMNRRSVEDALYTGVVVQYRDDGVKDGHHIAFQLDEVKYQYGCFFRTFLDTGIARVPEPMPLGTPCP